MSFFRKLNRKQRRQFDKLEQEEKNQIIAREISEKIKETSQKQIAVSFIKGTIWANKILYDKYVTAWDAANYNDKRKVAKELIDEIRMRYENSIKKENETKNNEQEEYKEEK